MAQKKTASARAKMAKITKTGGGKVAPAKVPRTRSASKKTKVHSPTSQPRAGTEKAVAKKSRTRPGQGLKTASKEAPKAAAVVKPLAPPSGAKKPVLHPPV